MKNRPRTTRRLAIALVVSSTADMSVAMNSLTSAFATLRVDTAEPGVTVGRRLRSVLSTLQCGGISIGPLIDRPAGEHTA